MGILSKMNISLDWQLFANRQRNLFKLAEDRFTWWVGRLRYNGCAAIFFTGQTLCCLLGKLACCDGAKC